MIRLRTSLFRHIVLWYTVCTMLIVAIYTLILYGEVKRGRERPFDVRLDAMAAELADDLQHSGGQLDIARLSAADLSTRAFAIFSPNWELLLASVPWQNVTWSTNTIHFGQFLERTRAGKRYHAPAKDGAGQDLRLSIAHAEIAPLVGEEAVPGATNSLPVYVAVADMFEPTDQFLWRQKYRMATAFVVVCIAVLVSGLLVARLGVWPITLLATTAERITPEDSRTRLPVTKLPHELRVLALTLNQAFDRLDAALQSERTFTAAAAHEIRSPLAALIARAQRIRYDAALPPPLAAQLDAVLGEAERLTRLSGQLLLLARLDRAAAGEAFPTQAVDLAEVAQDVLDSLREAAAARDVHLHLRTQGATVVQGHEEWLLRAVYNLVNNAINYTARETNVVVALEPTADGTRVLLSVSDAGPGIAPGERAKVVQRFYRGDRTRATEGTGLGLAIVRDVLRAHKGELFIAEGTGGIGARITMIVPVTMR
ncbi:MAG: HAMP domain-containing sensor histidine kinase [bacterium]|nr:HAMP domain-containing sensor histidine kinase [bacterium]